jgi:hypothetical protein
VVYPKAEDAAEPGSRKGPHKIEKPAAEATTAGLFHIWEEEKVNMLSEETESHPYEPNGKRFVIQTLCRVIAQAQSWGEVMIGCEALENSLRIAKEIEGASLRGPSQATAALGHLKELGKEIREHNGKSDVAADSNAQRAADSAVSRDRTGKSDGANRSPSA